MHSWYPCCGNLDTKESAWSSTKDSADKARCWLIIQMPDDYLEIPAEQTSNSVLGF